MYRVIGVLSRNRVRFKILRIFISNTAVYAFNNIITKTHYFEIARNKRRKYHCTSRTDDVHFDFRYIQAEWVLIYCGLYFIGTYIIAVYNYIKSESENADSSVFSRAHSCHQRRAINGSVTDKRVSQLYIQIIYIILLPMSRSEDDFFFSFPLRRSVRRRPYLFLLRDHHHRNNIITCTVNKKPPAKALWDDNEPR